MSFKTQHIQVDGSLNVDGSLYLGEVLFSPALYTTDVSVQAYIAPYATNASVGIAIADISLGNLSDITLVSPTLNQLLGFNGTDWINVNPNAISAGAGVMFFLDDTSSNVTGYDTLASTPAGGAENIDSVVVNNNTLLLDSYISASTGLGGTQIDGGVWEFSVWNTVSSATAITKILVDVYKYTPAAVETLLFSVSTGELNSTTVIEDTIDTVQPIFVINPSDRLVVKYSATTTRTSNTTVSLYHNGTAHYSHIHTPLSIRHNDLAGLQGGTSTENYHMTLSELTQAQGMKSYVDGSIAPFATNASIGTAAFAKNASLGLYVQKAGDTMSGNLTMNSSLYVSGFIGIGTTTPLVRCEVVDNSLTDGEHLILKVFPSSRSDGAVSIGYNIVSTSDNYGIIRSQHGSDLGLGAGSPTHLFIKQSGNVGIGDTNPTLKFVVAGDVSISANIWVKGMSSATGANAVYYQADGKLTQGAATAGPQGATGTGTQGATGTGTQGATGTGTQGATGTGTQGATGTGTQGATGANAGITSFTNSTNNYVLTAVSSSTINGEANLQFSGSTLAVTGSITATGDITSAFTSDKRLKTNIKPLDKGLLEINKLSPISFKWNELAKEYNENKDLSANNFGLIAQEVEEIFPDLIHKMYKSDMKGIDYIQLIPILVQGIKELKEEIDKLKIK